MLRLQKGSPGDDSWVSTGSEVEEECSGCNGKEEEYGDCRANFPYFFEHEDWIGDNDDNSTEIEAHVGKKIAERSCDATAAEPVFSWPGLV